MTGVDLTGPRFMQLGEGAVGMGHLRRMQAIAHGMAEDFPTMPQLVVTQCGPGGLLDWPRSAELLMRPAFVRDYLDAGKAGDESRQREVATFTRSLAQPLLATALETFAPQVLLTDVTPNGRHAELEGVLDRFSGTLLHGMRDAMGTDPLGPKERWLEAPTVLERISRVLVYTDPEVFDPLSYYAVPEALAGKFSYVGFVGRVDVRHTPAEVRAEFGLSEVPFILVTAGAGGGDRLFTVSAEALRDPRLADFGVVMVLGPNHPAQGVRYFSEMLRERPNSVVVHWTGMMHSLMAAAEVVICRGGGSSTVELAALGKRAVRAYLPGSDQEVRARAFERRGYGRAFAGNTVTAADIADGVVEALASAPPPALAITGVSGVVEAVRGYLR